MRIALGIEYQGANYHGWQKQGELPTVQSVLENALAKVANCPVNTLCAGRTDTGVHAKGQVVHFDTDAQRSDHSWVFGGNSYLPADISIRWAKQVAKTFHARSSATARRYQYVIYDHSIKPALLLKHVTWHHYALNEKRMTEAAQYLIGKHDFNSYRAIYCQSRSSIRQVYEISLERKEHLIILTIKADGFLHHMVRNIAGVLIEIGEGKREPLWAKQVLEARERRLGGVTAPPFGLYLVSVDYPAEYQIPINNMQYLPI